MEERIARNRDRGYRRSVQRKARRRLLEIVAGRYLPFVGWVKEEYVDGRWIITGNHVKENSRSERKKFLKQQSNRRVRHSGDISDGNAYRKHYNLQGELW